LLSLISTTIISQGNNNENILLNYSNNFIFNKFGKDIKDSLDKKTHSPFSKIKQSQESNVVSVLTNDSIYVKLNFINNDTLKFLNIDIRNLSLKSFYFDTLFLIKSYLLDKTNLSNIIGISVFHIDQDHIKENTGYVKLFRINPQEKINFKVALNDIASKAENIVKFSYEFRYIPISLLEKEDQNKQQVEINPFYYLFNAPIVYISNFDLFENKK